MSNTDERIEKLTDFFSSHTSINEKDSETLANLLAYSVTGYGAFEDILDDGNRERILTLLVEVLPFVFPLLNNRWKDRKISALPETYYTKRTPLSESAIRELIVYTGFETEVEFYGWKILPDFTVEMYIEKGIVLQDFTNPTEFLPVDWERQMIRSARWLLANGLVHRDIKAINFIVSQNGLLKLIDFGSTVLEGEVVENLGYTHGYDAPEVRYAFVNSDLDTGMIRASSKSDWWSIGVTIFTL